MDSSYPEAVRSYYAEALQNETQPAMHLFWTNWLKWRFEDMAVEEEDIEDSEAEGSGRRSIKISCNGKVQMIAQTSSSKDPDAEVIAAQTAQYHLDMRDGFRIFVLVSQGTRCNVLRMRINAGISEWDTLVRNIELPKDDAKLLEVLRHGFRYARIPDAKEKIHV